LIEPSAELIAHGKELFESNCIACHGSLGHGDGPAAGTMIPHPRNFASPAGWKNGVDLPGIFKTLSEGIAGTSMAPFDYLTRSDRMALAHQVQALGSFPRNAANPQTLAALSKELASSGEQIHNKIPVSMAMAKLEEEYAARPPFEIDVESQSPSAEILRRAVINQSRVSKILAESNAWRATPSNLAAAILPDVPENGFSAGTANLSPSDWNALHAELLKQVRSK
jgi:mono/diheme cytochrome c family protein